MEYKTMTPKYIDINDWVLAGEGGNGQVYYHKSDDGIILKLNRVDMAKDRVEREFVMSKAVYDSGIPCPQVYDYVTDGARIGMTAQRIKDKKSFARMISEDKSQLDALAKEFAQRSKAFHATPCDPSKIQNYKDWARSLYGSCDALSEEAKKILNSYLDDMSDVVAPLHGDFQPGNIIRAGGRDYWIDLGDVSYGDPDLDMASLLVLTKYTPSRYVKYLFHISRKEMERFVEVYGMEYYGSRWHSRELDEKLDKVLCLRMGMSMVSNPRSAIMFMPYILGKRFKANLIFKLIDLLLTERHFRKR